MIRILIITLLLTGSNVWADDSDIVKADRQALADAMATGISSKILSAKEQLSDDLGLEADQKRQDDQGINIPLIADGQGHLMADVLVNNRVHAFLVVDTGSPVVMLTAKLASQLGLDLSQANKGYVEILNGKYQAAAVDLDSLKLGDAEAKNISTTVLLEDCNGIKDGLLGMSFLSQFHFTLDEKGQKLILRKLDGTS